MQDQSLRTLMVEDSEDDVQLIIRELKKGGYNPLYERVETAVAMKKALQEKQWDIILCDYKMPQFNVPSAIALLKETNIDIPLIIISGAIGEETAVECMRLGAHDYIMKANLSRLCPAIARELDEAEFRNKKKLAEEELRLSEEKERTILENIEDGYYETDLAGNYTFFNDSLCRIHGYTKEELMGMNNRQYTDKEYSKKLFNTFNEVYKTGQSAKGFGWQIIRKDGTKRYIEASVSLRKDLSDKPIGFRGITRDVTERRKMEEEIRQSEERYRTILDEMENGYFEVDLAGNYTFINDANCRHLGYSKKEILGLNFRIPMVKESVEIVKNAFTNIYMTGKPQRGISYKAKRKDGTTGFAEISGFPLKNKEGEIIGFRGMAFDITERRQAESQIEDALKALQESDQKYRLLFNEMISGFAVHEIICDQTGKPVDYRFLAVNDVFEKMTGLSSGDIVGKTVREVLPATEPVWIERYGKVALAREPVQFENYSSALGKCYEVRAFSPEPGEFATIINDITERKRTEEKLQKSEELYTKLVDSIPDIIVRNDLVGKILFINDYALKISGYSREEIEGHNMLEFFPAEEHERLIQETSLMLERRLGPREYNLLAKDGRKIPLEINGDVLRNEDGTPFGLVTVSRDISERKNAEKKLRESERKLREAQEMSHLGHWIWDVKTGKVEWSDEVFKIFQLDPNSFTPQIDSIQDLSPWPEDHERDKELIRKATVNHEKGSYEQRFLRLDKSIGYYFSTYQGKYDDNGNLVSIVGTVQDITERKMVDDELKRTLDSLKKAVGTTIQVLVSALEARDPYTAGHQARVADLACAIATEMGLAQEIIDGIQMAGSIHDIGKISIPVEILSKPTKLTDIEFSMIKEHSQIGYDILKDVESSWPLAQIVYQHHERINGSGYPRKLKGDEIIIEARIMAVADVVEAMASHRPYRAALGIEFAIEEIKKNKGILYDDVAADICLKLFLEKGYRFP